MCLCIYIYSCIYAYIHTRGIHICISTQHICIYTFQINVYVCICAYTYIYMYIHIDR